MHRFMPLLIVGLIVATVSGSFDGVLYPSDAHIDTITQQPEQRPVNERDSVRYRTESQTGQPGLNVNPMLTQRDLTQRDFQDAIAPGNAPDRTTRIIINGDDGEQLRIWSAYNEPNGAGAPKGTPNDPPTTPRGTPRNPQGTPDVTPNVTPDSENTFTPDGSLVCSDQNCTVNIRSRPHVEAAIACSGPNGTPGNQIRSAGDWLNIDFGDCVGWVRSDFYKHQ